MSKMNFFCRKRVDESKTECKSKSKKAGTDQTQDQTQTQKNDYQTKVKEKRRLSCLLIWFSTLVIVATAVILFFVHCVPHWLKLVCEILSGVAASALAGGIVAYTADIPSIVNSFKGLIVDSLTSNSYLENIDVDQLKSIKKTVVKNLHKNVELPESLLQLDANLGDMFDNPYYSFFNEIVFCHKQGTFEAVSLKMREKEEGSQQEENQEPQDNTKISNKQQAGKVDYYVLKDITNEYEIINPNLDEAVVDIGLQKCFDLPSGKTTKELFLLQQFEVQIDDHKKVDIEVDVETFTKKALKRSAPETMTYDSTLGLVLKGSPKDKELTASNIDNHKKHLLPDFNPRDSDTPCELLVRFKNKVRVVLKYRMIIPVRDNHYTRRMRYSSESLLLSYHCEDNVQIHGQVLGTLVKQDKITIVQDDNHKNSIMIQCRGWLLPGNGIFVVLDDK